MIAELKIIFPIYIESKYFLEHIRSMKNKMNIKDPTEKFAPLHIGYFRLNMLQF